ncbi:hypothetical protein AX16_007333 [Volvariella volvacea WC 439]|nr:hypothetical protein AX16_007333 [Volvariella volvacea WC 439]
MVVPNAINGFTIIPTKYAPKITHFLYVRKHAGSKKEKSKALPEGRTLFVVNVPPDATERELILFFKPCGTVERVTFKAEETEAGQDAESDDSEAEGEDVEMEGGEDEEDEENPRRRRKTKDEPPPPKVVPIPTKSLRTLRSTGRTAHVIFLDTTALDRALVPPEQPQQWPTSTEEPLGVAHYLARYQSLRPPLDAVREYADSAIEVYEYEQEKKKQKSKYKKGEAIVDEDGFTLVTRGGAYGQTLGGGVAVASKRFQTTGETSSRKRKKATADKAGFYAFQKAEKQRKGQVVLFIIEKGRTHA